MSYFSCNLREPLETRNCLGDIKYENDRLSNYSSVAHEVSLSNVLQNLSPLYTMQLHVIHVIQELEAACLELKVKEYRSELMRHFLKKIILVVNSILRIQWALRYFSDQISLCCVILKLVVEIIKIIRKFYPSTKHCGCVIC